VVAFSAENRHPLFRKMLWSMSRFQRSGACLGHDPEKWVPVFGKDHAPTISWSGMAIRRKVSPL
jgi:hypothetical protein